MIQRYEFENVKVILKGISKNMNIKHKDTNDNEWSFQYKRVHTIQHHTKQTKYVGTLVKVP
jgi:hypothetical protein